MQEDPLLSVGQTGTTGSPNPYPSLNVHIPMSHAAYSSGNGRCMPLQKSSAMCCKPCATSCRNSVGLARPFKRRLETVIMAQAQDLDAAAEDKSLSEEYTDVMQERMGSNNLFYRHEDGMNYNRILPDLIVGSCLQTAADVNR
jgi:hypothetical protein